MYDQRSKMRDISLSQLTEINKINQILNHTY